MKTTKQKNKKDSFGLERGHVIHTLASEHDMILHFLDKLEQTNKSIQKMIKFDGKKKEFSMLSHVIEHLIAADAHHKREEKALFPEIEKHGIVGPSEVMRAEHNHLKQREKNLAKLIKAIYNTDFGKFKKQIKVEAEFIIAFLREHIFKENNVLYPMALQVIKDIGIWQSMKKKCDKIGYCCFTPHLKVAAPKRKS